MSLKIGFAKANIDPPLGIGMRGYFIPRYAKGFYDSLFVRTIAVANAEKKALIINVDFCSIDNHLVSVCHKRIVEETGIAKENIFMGATHTHTGPLTSENGARFAVDMDMIENYAKLFVSRVLDSVKLALVDLKPAKMGFAIGHAPERIAYIRRYRMKDGSTFTCPPINDPNIVGPIGELDQRINVLRFKREDADDVVIVNYGIHADTVNGDIISADFPHWLSKTVRDTLDAECVFIPGAQGDVGSTNVHPSGGDMNDTEISFDNEMKSYGMARFVGRAIAGTVLQVFDKVEFTEDDSIEIAHKSLVVPANNPKPEEMPLAIKYKELHETGRDDEIPFEGMQLTTEIADAYRKCRLEHGPFEFTLPMMGLKIGPVAFVGMPGEPFTEIGVKIKETDGFSMIMPAALVNGSCGYFPAKSAFDEGGYEARTSDYTSVITEEIVKCGKEILAELR